MFVPQRFVALSDGQQRRPKEEAKEGKEGHEGKEGKEGEEGGEAEGEELTNEDSAESFSFARMCAFSCEVMGQKTEGTEGSGVRVQSTWFWANYNDFTSLEWWLGRGIITKWTYFSYLQVSELLGQPDGSYSIFPMQRMSQV